MSLRIAVVGAGVIGREHLKRIAGSRRARVACVVDPYAGAEWGVPRFADVGAMLAAGRPDAAIVATPTDTHAEVGEALLEAGVPLLVEKPLAGTVEEGERLVRASEKAGVPVLVGHHRRHSAWIGAARKAIGEGLIGRLVAVQASTLFYKPDAYFEVAWRRGPAGGPVLINLVHDVDTLRYLGGEIVAVQAVGSSATRGFGVEDTAAVIVEFASGAVGTMLVSDTTVAARSWEQTSGENAAYARDEGEDCLFLAGTEGSLAVPSMRWWRQEGEKSWMKGFARGRMEVKAVDPLERQLEHFCDVVEGRAAPVVSAGDGLRTLAVTMGVRACLRGERRWVVGNG